MSGAETAVVTSPTALELVGLGPLMASSHGGAEVGIGLVDGPVANGHPDLAAARIRTVGAADDACVDQASSACAHGTFVAGILVGSRDSAAPGIAPGCTLLLRPIFREADGSGPLPTATPDDLGRAIVECVEAGARIVNLSAATGRPTTRTEAGLRRALDHATRRGALIVAAAGNQAALGSSEITRHPGVIPVVGYDRAGRPMNQSNFGATPGRRGVGAPADGIVSLSAAGPPVSYSGTSFAAAFVTGALALLWSLAPEADGGRLRRALLGGPQRTSVIPPLMDAHGAHRRLVSGVA